MCALMKRHLVVLKIWDKVYSLFHILFGLLNWLCFSIQYSISISIDFGISISHELLRWSSLITSYNLQPILFIFLILYTFCFNQKANQYTSANTHFNTSVAPNLHCMWVVQFTFLYINLVEQVCLTDIYTWFCPSTSICISFYD